MAKRTAVWRCVDNYLVEVFGSEAISKAEWGELVAEIAKRRDSLRGVLVVTGSAAPSATQRAELTESLHGSDVLAAVMTSSALVRMALTAINYFVRGQARPFAPEQLDTALSYLKVPGPLWPQIRRAIATLQAELDSAS
jgi:hypothetical protein